MQKRLNSTPAREMRISRRRYTLDSICWIALYAVEGFIFMLRLAGAFLRAGRWGVVILFSFLLVMYLFVAGTFSQ